MTTIYWAIVSALDSDGRLANLTQALATKEAYSVNVSARTATALAGTVYWTNMYTGAYLISVSDATDGMKVIFRGLVHTDDQAGFADFAALLDQGIDLKADLILEDTGTTLATAIAALPTVAQIWSYATRTLTSFGTAVADIAKSVWEYTGLRSLNSFIKVALMSGLTPDGGTMEVVIGDDYNITDGDTRAFTWTSAYWPDLTGATITFYSSEKSINAIAMVTVTPGVGNQGVRIAALSKTITAAAIEGEYNFYVKAVLASSSRVVTLIKGKLNIKQQLEPD